MQSVKRGALPRCVGRTKGGINTKLHAVVDGKGRPIILTLTGGQVSDHTGAKLLYSSLPDFRDRKTTKRHKAVLLGDWTCFRKVPTNLSLSSLVFKAVR